MSNLSVYFTDPWLLLLLIPAFAVTFFLYFRMNKRYRRTRNRVISVLLHCIVITLAISVLSGIRFTYTISNPENEILLVVDVSDTEEAAAERRDEFVRSVIGESSYDGYRLGVVTFGFTQLYAVPITDDMGRAAQDYMNAPPPSDTTGTDIAAALEAAEHLFTHPESAKIVLITDGKQTDEDAGTVIKRIADKGIRVDTVFVPSDLDDAVSVIGMEFPDYHIAEGEIFTIGVSVQCGKAVPGATVRLFDNGVAMEDGETVCDLAAGTQTINFRTSFTAGLHEVGVEIVAEGDALAKNNRYTAYFNLEVYKKVLILEQAEGESEELSALLGQEGADYEVDVLNLRAGQEIPSTVEDLLQYDQVILNNIASADLPEGFDELLYTYVYRYGGGMFTAGGSDEDGTAHAYNRADMDHALLHDMLPVQVIDYTPPVGVIIVIDVSGSMGNGSDGTPLYWAKQGAIACLDALHERDYVGIMTLDSVYGTILAPTERTKETLIREAILSIEMGNNTIFSDAIRRAGEQLKLLKQVDKRHIILVTDGQAAANDKEKYLAVAQDLYDTGEITCSVVGIGMSAGDTFYEEMETLVGISGGRVHCATDQKDLIREMREDLRAPEITEVDDEPFHPVVSDTLSPLLNGVEYGEVEGETGKNVMDAMLGGFYGVKKRELSEVILEGEYQVPIYAQWKFGNGMVGSFMCDLSGKWSSEFMHDASGERFLLNVVSALMPTQDIRPKDMRILLEGENYFNRMSVASDVKLGDGEYYEGTIVNLSTNEEIPLGELTDAEASPGCYVTLALGEANGYTRCSFVLKESGVYKIVVNKRSFSDPDTILATAVAYKTFSYSKEYDPETEEEEELRAFLSGLAEQGEGSAVSVEEPWNVFEGFSPRINGEYDPRLPFIIVAMALFLLDIAVRKFKFKWIHELVREHREKKGTK